MIDEIAARMNEQIGALKRSHALAFQEVSGTWSVDATAKQQNLGQIAAIGAKITDLDTRLRQEVYSGRLPFAKWEGIAQTLHEGLQAQAAIVGDWSLRSGLSYTFSQSVEQITDAAKKAGAGLAIGGSVLLVVAGFIALIIYAPMISRLAK